MRPSGGVFSLVGLTALLTAGLLLPAPSAMAQKREDFIALQRDVAQLQDQLKQMQTDQEQKLAALQALVQQALDASKGVTSGMAALQSNLKISMTEEQTRVTTPLATLNNKVNQVSEDIGAIKENVSDLDNRLSKLDSKLGDISTAVRTLSTPPPAPPSANNASAGGPAAPAGVNPENLFENIRRDVSSGNDTIAMQEITDFLKYFPMNENAPEALYDMGMLYDRAKPPDYDSAIQAFDAVGERYPENPKTPEALYMKGVDLMKAKRPTEAGVEFRNFLKTYPNHPDAPKAQAHLRELGLSSGTPRGKKK